MKSNDCALQHIKVFRAQALKGEAADFGEPCQTCIYAKDCNFEWLSILSPLLNQSEVKINMAVQEPSLLQDKDQSGIERGTDIQRHTGKKSE